MRSRVCGYIRVNVGDGGIQCEARVSFHINVVLHASSFGWGKSCLSQMFGFRFDHVSSS